MSLCVWNLVVKLNYSKYIVEVSRFRRFCTAPCNYPFLAIIRSARRTEVGVPRIVYARNSTHGYKKSSVSKYLYNGNTKELTGLQHVRSFYDSSILSRDYPL